VSFMLGGTPPFPDRTADIRNTAQALAARDAYAKEAEATGLPLAISMHLKRGERAPAGFRQAERGWKYVNCNGTAKPDPEKAP